METPHEVKLDAVIIGRIATLPQRSGLTGRASWK
jgi:hypothetical protein